MSENAVITGGTGSLGSKLLRRLLALHRYRKVTIFSRDETKQDALRAQYQLDSEYKDEFNKSVQFVIGDVRNYHAVVRVLQDADVVFNAAALKQVPTCEYYPFEAALTNIMGAENIVAAIQECALPVRVVVGISTDKACKPVNVMGMTKAIQERLFIQANLRCPHTRFVCVRYGNVLASRGSVIPLFQKQIANGGPVTVTTKDMTRFLLSLDAAVDIVLAAVETGRPGEIYIPRIPSARIVDVAEALVGNTRIPIRFTGIRPGEKLHEILVSEEETHRTAVRGAYYAIAPCLPEIGVNVVGDTLLKEYSSNDVVLDYDGVVALLRENGFIA